MPKSGSAGETSQSVSVRNAGPVPDRLCPASERTLAAGKFTSGDVTQAFGETYGSAVVPAGTITGFSS